MTSILVLLTVVMTVTGCTISGRRHPAANESSHALTPGASNSNGHRPRDASMPVVKSPLAIEDAIRLALAHHPDLTAWRARVEAAIGRTIQVSTFPDPVFSAGIESAPIHGKTSGNAEYPIGITQTLPLGGRLGKAAQVEDARHVRLLAELQNAILKVERNVRGAFAVSLFTRDALAVEHELLAGSQETAKIAKARADAGDAATDEQARAELEAARARVSVQRAEIAAKRALIELSGALGHAQLAVSEVEGQLESSLSLPELERVLARIEESPILRAHAAAIEEGQAAILYEEARRVPDIDVGVFYRWLAETDENAFDVAIALPIPIFDQREGALRRAQAAVLEARANYQKADTSLATTIQTVYWKLNEELEIARLYREELTPRSETVLRAADERYRAGDVSLADLIPIRREHRELRLSYLAVLRSIATHWAEFRSLVQSRA